MSTQSFGKYVVTKSLGKGGMAEVFLARDPLLERNVAIKVIHPHLATDPGFGERFRREAKLVASLRHAHIVQLYDFDIQNDQPFMVMEFLDAGTLKDRFAKTRAMPFAEIAHILDAIASALDFAHARGAVHRDVKPTNILFTSNDEPVLADFGIAKIVGDAAQLSASGAIVGSPAYMAPEQAASKPVDTRADIYALGVVLYEMLTGRVPFQGDSPTAVLMQHLNAPPPPPRQFNANIPDVVQQVVLQALAKNPAERFARAGDLARAFSAALRGEVIEAAELTGAQTFIENAGASAGEPPAPQSAAPHQTWLSQVGGIAEMVGAFVGRDAPDVRASRQDRRRLLASVLGILGILIAALQLLAGFFDLLTRPLAPLLAIAPYLVIVLFIASGALAIYVIARSSVRANRLRASIMLSAIVIVGAGWGAWTVYDRLTPPSSFIVLIADFEKLGGAQLDVARLIEQELKNELRGLGSQVTIQRARQLVTDEETARARGAEQKATLVIWGAYDDQNVDPAIELLQLPVLARESFVIPTFGASAIARVPTLNQVTRNVRSPAHLHDLKLFAKSGTQQISYVATAILATAFYANDDLPRALALFDKTIVKAGTDAQGIESIYFLRASVLVDQNRLSDAAADLEKSIARKPDLAEAHHNLAIVYAETCNPARQIDRAIAEAEIAARLAPSNARMHRLLGDLYRLTGKTDQAIAELQTAVKLDPNDAPAYEMLSTLQTGADAQASRQTAAALREKAISSSSDALSARLALGDAYLAINELDKALAEFQAAQKIAPNDARIQRGLASVYFWKKDFAAAERAAQSAAQLAPRDASTHMMLGLLYHEQGKPPAAMDEMKQAAKLDACLADAHLVLGGLYYTRNDYANALNEYQTAATIDPQNADAWYIIGALEYQENKYADAARALETAVKLRPTHARAWSALGAVYNAQKQFLQAVDARARLVKLEPNEPANHAELAYAYSRVDRLDDAIAAYQKSLGMKDDALNRLYLALVFDQQKKYDLAIVEFQKAYALDPNLALDLSSLSPAYAGFATTEARRCNLTTATQAASLAVRFNPKDVFNRNLLATAYLAQGWNDDAGKLYAELRAAPSSDFFAHLLAGEYYLRESKYEDAAREIQIALNAPNLTPLGVSLARYDLGQIYFEQNQLADAEREFQRALDAYAGNALAQFRRGDLALRRGDFANALIEYDRTAALLPAFAKDFSADTATLLDAFGRAHRALALTRQRKTPEANAAFDDAVAAAQKIVNQNSQWASAHFTLGYVYLARGDKPKADAEFVAALRCDQSLGAARVKSETELAKLR
ncbi:MAG: tetratricopeptide repeat protein [Chloroflexi bacterium]|nr:tetratricopeptide repeat protein [Chloroflexota bacterium]